jgi:hypothetical protein
MGKRDYVKSVKAIYISDPRASFFYSLPEVLAQKVWPSYP